MNLTCVENVKTMLIVSVVGAESTGKSNLVLALSKHYQVAYLEEFVRFYFDFKMQTLKGKSLDVSDVEKIAMGQHLTEEILFSRKPSLAFLDTNLLMTKMYGAYYYNFFPAWIEQVLSTKPYSAYLFCQNDIGWTFDTQRDSVKTQTEMTNILTNELQKLNVPIQKISGNYENRLAQAIQFVDGLLTI